MISSYTPSLPKFSNYREENCDAGYETLQDFFLSWTLRCADQKFKGANDKINEYARKTVFLLLFGDNSKDIYSLGCEMPTDFKVTNVQTKRQYKAVDLVALVTIEDKDNQSKQFALNIENKWYTSLKDHQLEKNKRQVESGFSDYEIINLFITCDNCRMNYTQEKKLCIQNGYKYVTIDDIVSITRMEPTGNALFDTYWFKM